MLYLRTLSSLASLLFASLASAAAVNSLSFGDRIPISPRAGELLGYKVQSLNHDIQVLSDRIILTPPVPGGAKASLWSLRTTETADWEATLEFRASGQETGSGNLQLWYTKGNDNIALTSVYNAGKFDGLVLVVDQYGGGGGKIRGFLNDGGVDFSKKAALESLAFGHCDYSYRNLGRPSKLKVQNQGGLTVSVDDKVCFSSNKISLPAGYNFGISATTSENPDSFEVQKFLVTSDNASPRNSGTGFTHGTHNPSTPRKMTEAPDPGEWIPERNADEIKTEKEQFTDLHNRMQDLARHMSTLFWLIKDIRENYDSREKEVLSEVQQLQHAQIDTASKLNAIQTTVNGVLNEVGSKEAKQNKQELHEAINLLHHNVRNDLPTKFENGELNR